VVCLDHFPLAKKCNEEFNGDWEDHDEILHHCDGRHGGENGCRRFLGKQGADAMMPGPPDMWDSHRWGHENEPLEDVMKFCSPHGLVEDAYAAALGGEDLDPGEDTGAPTALGGGEEQLGGTAQMQKEQSQRVRDTRGWTQDGGREARADAALGLNVFQPYHHRGAREFQSSSQDKLVGETLKEEQGLQRSFSIVDQAMLTTDMIYFEETLVKMRGWLGLGDENQPQPQKLWAPYVKAEGATLHSAAVPFRMMHRLELFIFLMNTCRHRRYPSRLWLGSEECEEVFRVDLRADSECTRCSFSDALLEEEFPADSSERRKRWLKFILKFLAYFLMLNMATLEDEHGGEKRHKRTGATRTRLLSHVSASSLFRRRLRRGWGT
jgi:hypothetical protein